MLLIKRDLDEVLDGGVRRGENWCFTPAPFLQNRNGID